MGLVWQGKYFKYYINHFLNPVRTNSYRFGCVFTEETGKFGTLVFEKMPTHVEKYIEKTLSY
jgi:hypothetical protein